LSIITQNTLVLDLDWIITEPIDYEYKQYQLLGYLQKIDERFDKFQIYPSFKELSLHLANVKSILSDGTYIELKKEVTELDEEIILGDLEFIRVPRIKDEDSTEFQNSVRFAEQKITEYFLIGKSLWSLINDTIEVRNVFYKSSLRENFGFIVIHHDNLKFIYQYEIRTLRDGVKEKDIFLENIYVGDGIDVQGIIVENAIFENYAFKARFDEVNLPIFEVYATQKFDFEHSIKPLVKRKVMTYINQSTRVSNTNF
jgi:hypothetical protein